MKRTSLLASLALLMTALAPQTASAAVYYNNITNTSDFDLSGTFIFAHRFGTDNTTLTVGSANFTLNNSIISYDGTYPATPAGPLTPANFSTLLSYGVYGSYNPISLTSSPLTIGQNYELQLFFSNNSDERQFNISVEGVNQFLTPLLLASNTASGAVINFTATDATLNVLISSYVGYTFLSAATLKAVEPVPEPGTAMLLGLAAVPFVYRFARRRRHV